MVVTSPERTKLAAWLGYVRAGSRIPPSLRETSQSSGGSLVEIGRAAFSLPGPGEAETTSWAGTDTDICVFSGYLFTKEQLARDMLLDNGTTAKEPPSCAEVVLAGYRRWGSSKRRARPG